jgi:hypothetical protein
MNQLSFAVYAMKCEKSPQATLGFFQTLPKNRIGLPLQKETTHQGRAAKTQS